MKPKSCAICGIGFQSWWNFCPECGEAVEDFDDDELPTAEDVRGIIAEETERQHNG